MTLLMDPRVIEQRSEGKVRSKFKKPLASTRGFLNVFRTKEKDGGREGYKYYFGLKQCKACPLHDEYASDFWY